MILIPDSNGEPEAVREVNRCHGKGKGHPCDDDGKTPRRPRPMPNRDDYTKAHKVIGYESGGPITQTFKGDGK